MPPVGQEPSAPVPTGADRARAETGKFVLLQLHELINSGAYPRGHKLPPERDLAEQLGVGRPALREAIRALNVLGLLETRRGSGTYIKSARPQNLIFDPLSLSESNFGLLELLEVLKVIEPRAAWLAGSRASEMHMREIEAARRELEKPGLEMQRLIELDLGFHCAILRAAQNRLLLLLHQVLHPLLLKPAAAIVRAIPDDLEELLAQHNLIADAILRRRPDQAEKAMIDHLDSWARNYLERGEQKE